MNVGQKVKIPTSELGQIYVVGTVIEKFGEIVKVDFQGHIGIYTTHKHDIQVVG